MKTFAAILAAASLSFPLFASTSTWNTTDGSWEDFNNWDPVGVPNSSTTQVVFADQGQACLVELPFSRNVFSLTFDSPYSYTIIATNPALRRVEINGNSPNDLVAVYQGSHRLVGTLYTEGNSGGALLVSNGCAFTVEGDMEAPASSGRGFRDKTGDGDFIVTGMTYSSDWGSPNVQAGTLALRGGLLYRNSYLAQNNKTLTVSPGATLSAGGAFDSDDALTNSPSLNLDGTLDVHGTLNWNDGSLNFADAEALEFELGSSPDTILYNVDKSPSPVLTGPSGTALIRLTEGPGFTAGTYDLLDWSAALNLTVTDLSLDDFVVEKPVTWTVQLKFDNNVQTADVNTTKLQVIAVPEPACAVAAVLGLLLLRRK